MLNWLKSTTASARATLAAEASKFRNREFMQAIVAACALMAAADGNISSEEKQKMMGYIRSADELKHFDTGEVISFFEAITSKFEFDVEIGRAEALKVIGRVKDKEEQARMVVRVACVIGAADGTFDDDEKSVARTIAVDLGLPPADFDL
ncbi:tellurite resistance TerB family protein [Epibacterium sp. DP7N7-1]|nr:tellurite resistance TerB family protein [Epibacterium sp. DP7N7-1]